MVNPVPFTVQKAEESEAVKQKCQHWQIKYYFCERLNQYSIEDRSTTYYRE